MTVTRRTPTTGEREAAVLYMTDYVAIEGGFAPRHVLTFEQALTVDYPVTWTSGDTDIATVSAGGIVERVADGRVTITGATIISTASVTLDMIAVAEVPSDAPSPEEGSAYSASQGLLDSIDGETPSGATVNVFAGYYATDMTRNATCFAASLDLTGCSPYNSQSGRKKAGTVLARDIIVHARHFPGGLPVGTVVDFIQADDTRVTRTVLGSVDIAGTDIRLSRLSSDLPEGIAAYPILPSDYADYFSELSVTQRLPLLWIDQQERAKLAEWYGGGSVLEPANADALSWYTRPIAGDSGSPAFLLIGETLTLVGCLYGTTYAQPLAPYLTQINAAIASLGSEHTVTTVDLSGYAD